MATTISAAQVKELRERTGAGMMECKKALEEAGGNMEAAIDHLRARGAAKAAKRADRETREGTVGSYVHTNGKIGVLVEVQCETDFVSRNETFQQLARDLAMHVAAAAPLALDSEGIPADVVERERAVYLEQVKQEGKPEKMQEKIVEGKLRKFYQESTLMDQVFVKDPAGKQTIRQLIEEASAKTGEKVVVQRFVRFQLGE
ncbi:MAG TPA: translation elongation factor Ts [Longimicrobiales bacterium]|nr:translation elongation factor Ts [Longimicrobiales bacterium]